MAVFLWWCFCGGVLVWCGGVVVWWCGGVVVFVRLCFVMAFWGVRPANSMA